MAYRLYDAQGKSVTFHDLQDKTPWCQHGVTKENLFIAKYGKQLNLIINPEKENNKYAPDLMNVNTQNLADLKTENTPLFQAEERYGIPPQYAVVFNHKDFERYSKYYPKIDIYFWVQWLAVRFEKLGTNRDGDEYASEIIEVLPTEGVWFISFRDLTALVKYAPTHSYAQRQNDTRGNAKASYVLNLQNQLFTRVV